MASAPLEGGASLGRGCLRSLGLVVDAEDADGTRVADLLRTIRFHRPTGPKRPWGLSKRACSYRFFAEALPRAGAGKWLNRAACCS